MRREIKIIGSFYIGIKELPDEIALPTHAEQLMPVGDPYSLY
jgi:hypothetical protein